MITPAPPSVRVEKTNCLLPVDRQGAGWVLSVFQASSAVQACMQPLCLFSAESPFLKTPWYQLQLLKQMRLWVWCHSRRRERGLSLGVAHWDAGGTPYMNPGLLLRGCFWEGEASSLLLQLSAMAVHYCVSEGMDVSFLGKIGRAQSPTCRCE